MSNETIIALNNDYDAKPEIIDRTMSASSFFNCHGYAYHMSEVSIGDQVWIGYSNPDAVTEYWTYYVVMLGHGKGISSAKLLVE